jgi:hypothetical protein
LHGFYRGHRITKRVEVRLHTAAQIESTSPPRPEQGAVALVASAATNQQHRQGDGGVALVLDASGSMGPVDGATTFKYQTAVTAVGKLLTEMPAGVEVSVWVFGEAIGLGKTTDRAEQTIRRIMRPVRWDPNDTELLGELVERLSYPNVEPWNESPIARAVLAAADDLAAVEGFRSIVVVTDGMDNRFDRDLVANPSGRSLGDVLADALIDRGISMHVVGFRLAGDQQTQARAQFRFVEQLSPPGRWWEVDQQEGLEIALRRALKRNLEVELNPTDAKTNASVSLPVAPGGDVIRWSRGVLAPGTYQLDSQAKAPPVAVQGGDLLLLELAGSRPHFTAGRLGYANTMFPWRPTVLGDAWQTSLLAHRQATETNVEMLVALETRTDLAETPPVELIELQRPADVWFEYGVDRPDHARMLHWKSAWGHPAPCWQLSATAGDDDHEPATAPRELRVWWTNTADGTASRALRRGHDFTKPAKLAGTTWDVNGRDVQVLRLAVDAQELPAGDGSVRRQNCLTVELQVAPSSISSQLVKVRPVGLPEVGEQHQFFPEVGRYVGRFWPITSEQLENLIAGVDFVAIDQLKGEAESRGQYAELTELGPPSPTDQVPPPEINLFGGQSCYVKPRTHSN